VIYDIKPDFLNHTIDQFDQLGYETEKLKNRYIFFKHFFDLMRLIYTVFILLLVLMTSAQCQQTTKNIEIFNNRNIGGVDNSPSCNPSFTISQAYYITYIDTYHWNSGSGTTAGGTIGLRSEVGTEYGPWQTETTPGQGGVPNANWFAHPNETIPAGTYTIIDSDPSSWSQNSESNGCGFSKVEGYPIGQSDLTGSGKMTGGNYPQTLHECENGVVCGTWTLQGNQYYANWENGATAILTVDSWGASGVVINRHDYGGASAGLSARYEGQLNGNAIENGKITWTFEGSTHSGTWTANW
jgi:hypothetical protein